MKWPIENLTLYFKVRVGWGHSTSYWIYFAKCKKYQSRNKLTAGLHHMKEDHWNGMLPHSLGGEIHFFFEAFFALSLNLMPYLSTWLEIVACLHSRGTREAIRPAISRKEDKEGIQFKVGAINCCYENVLQMFTSPAWKLTCSTWN